MSNEHISAFDAPDVADGVHRSSTRSWTRPSQAEAKESSRTYQTATRRSDHRHRSTRVCVADGPDAASAREGITISSVLRRPGAAQTIDHRRGVVDAAARDGVESSGFRQGRRRPAPRRSSRPSGLVFQVNRHAAAEKAASITRPTSSRPPEPAADHSRRTTSIPVAQSAADAASSAAPIGPGAGVGEGCRSAPCCRCAGRRSATSPEGPRSRARGQAGRVQQVQRRRERHLQRGRPAFGADRVGQDQLQTVAICRSSKATVATPAVASSAVPPSVTVRRRFAPGFAIAALGFVLSIVRPGTAWANVLPALSVMRTRRS